MKSIINSPKTDFTFQKNENENNEANNKKNIAFLFYLTFPSIPALAHISGFFLLISNINAMTVVFNLL